MKSAGYGRLVLFVLCMVAAGAVAVLKPPEDWDLLPQVLVGTPLTIAAGAAGSFVTEVINARRKIVKDRRAPYEKLEGSREPPAGDSQSPTALLRPERAMVAFSGRADELKQLQHWCTDEAACPVSLVTGPGGVGKTRLALALGQAVRREKWCVERVRQGSEVQAVQAAAQLKEPVLLIIDYAETRSDVAEMMTDLVEQESAGRTRGVRVLLLARRANEWWTELDTTSDSARVLRDRAPVRELPPALDAKHDNRRIFYEALPYYANARGRPTPDAALPDSPEPLPILVLHAAALAAVLDDEHGTWGGRAAADLRVLDRLLDHESRLWANTARRLGLEARLPVLKQVIAVVALLLEPEISTESMLRHTLRRVPDLADVDASKLGTVVRWLRELYPTTVGAVEVLRPDLLAERHVANQLAEHEFLRQTCFTDLAESQKMQALTMLTRACTHHDHAGPLLDELLYNNLPDLAKAAITVTVQTSPALGERLATALHDAPAPDDALREIQANIPYPTVALSSAELEVTRRIYCSLPSDTNSADTAKWANNLARALAQQGRQREALEATTEAVRLYRELAKAHPDTFRPALARTLNNQANCLSELSRWEEALEMSTEAVQIWWELDKAHPDTFRRNLAGTLNNHAARLSELSRWEEALKASSEAVWVYRALAEARSDTFGSELAMSLDNYANCLSEVGRRQEAWEVSAEAVQIWWALAEARPDTFSSDLAMSLNNHAVRWFELGCREEALKAGSEAVRVYRALAEARPDTFGPDLAMSLNNHAVRLSELGRWEEVWGVSAEAVQIWWALAEARPAFRPDLAMSLNNHAIRLYELGRRQEALRTIAEAIGIWKNLVAHRPDLYQHQLDISLTIPDYLIK